MQPLESYKCLHKHPVKKKSVMRGSVSITIVDLRSTKCVLNEVWLKASRTQYEIGSHPFKRINGKMKNHSIVIRHNHTYSLIKHQSNIPMNDLPVLISTRVPFR